ncbi:MAG: radical SAM protein [Candidatus Omnitrophica bacterium]|nr:radical SAM protein [Candidatus Omnitrophota bacterium]
MKNQKPEHFYDRLHNRKKHYPWAGQIELTYRCNLNCIHCYCEGSEDKKANRELNTVEWKKILDTIREEGCLYLALTGGEPLVRDDFLDIYSYAKRRGFIITIFTNGQGFTKEIIDYLTKSPPYSIEITLNGITKDTYESITQTPDSYSRAVKTIKILAQEELPLVLKTNCLKQNRDELGEIKKWTEELLGKPSKDTHYFKYDPMIYPRLNGDKTPCNYRLSFEELQETKSQDPDVWEEYQKGLHADLPDLGRDRDFLYRCNSWMTQFFVNPYGRLKFCEFSEKFSVDLKSTPFKEGFYNFPKLMNEKFKSNSKCRGCSLRSICYYCPARAYLETGDEEGPVEYYCELAKATKEEMEAKLAALRI